MFRKNNNKNIQHIYEGGTYDDLIYVKETGLKLIEEDATLEDCLKEEEKENLKIRLFMTLSSQHEPS